MNIIITGACGHIGSYLISNINKIKKVKKIILIDNFYSNRYSSIFNLKKKNKFSFFKIDLDKRNSLNKFKNINLIIHCASYTNAENSFAIKKEMFKNNLNCMKNVMNYCIKNKAKLFHLSSTSVYGNQAERVFEDNNKYINPQSPYAEIKLIEEKMLLKKKSKLKFVTFRLGTIAGISKGMRFHTAINKFCLNAALNLSIEVYKTAYNQYRPYLSLKDLFSVFKFFIDNNIFNNNTYNVLTGNYTVKQILNKIRKFKKNIKIKFIKSIIMNQLTYFVDNKKIKKLGVTFNSDINDDIKKTLNLFNFK